MLAAANASVARGMPGHSRHPSLAGLPMHHNMDHVFGSMSAAMGQRGVSSHGLPKLETHSISGMDYNNNGLRTAPAMQFTNDFDFEGLLFGNPGSTINPNALHYDDSPQSMALDPTSPFGHGMPDLSAHQQLDDTIDWLSGFDHQMSFHTNENAVDGSSPSAISTTSQSGISDVMLDGSNHAPPVGTSSMWQSSSMGPPQMPNPFSLDMNSSVFPDLMNGSPMSPQPAHQKLNDNYFSTPPSSLTSLSPTLVNGMATAPQNMNQALSYSTAPETPTSLGGNQRTSPGPNITDTTRNAIGNALNQRPGFGRKYSMQGSGSPLSPQQFQTSPVNAPDQSKNLPSTQDLQRYVGAYLRYFHPHFPFLHIPTLSFDVSSPSPGNGRPAGVAGIGCLILSMSAIGAVYEMDHGQSRELFEGSKKLVQQYLEERRKADVRKADCLRTPGSDVNSQPQEGSSHTPVWLVQAMLLNVVYGHNSGDKTASDIASTHCAALVSLAQGADLLRQTRVADGQNPDTPMGDDASWNAAIKSESDDQVEWLKWKVMEERKRTLFCVFVLSSLLVTGYNHPPALSNSEVVLDLPCDEKYFAADSASAFRALGGVQAASNNKVSFHDALGDLLRTSEKQKHAILNGTVAGDLDDLPASNLNPSTFGCHVLINALHNYIWETRQRHHNKVWTGEEMETMHRHLEPALRAWQTAWAKSSNAGGDFSSGLDHLPADSVPLLEMAQIRLFVNLDRSKDKFWKRDWEGVAEELARGEEFGQHREYTPEPSTDLNGDSSDLTMGGAIGMDSPASQQLPLSHDFSKLSPAAQTTAAQSSSSSPPRRERYLRRAAFYAAESLCVTAKQDATTDLNVHKFSLQLAMCTLECAQVLAEWVATLQDRVGPYLGILGQDDVDLSQVPAIMLLEEEDVRLLGKVQEFLDSMGSRRNMQMGGGADVGFRVENYTGYATRILHLTANVLMKAGVWPVMHVIAECLETHAKCMRSRAEKSIRACE